MGVKDVSLKSTFWGFWWFWVGWSVGRVFGSGRPVGSACRAKLVDWFGVGSGLPYICGGRWSGVLDYIRRAGLTLAALWPLVGALRCLSC